MKKVITLFLFGTINVFSLSAQDKFTYYKDLIIQIPGIVKERGYPDIKNALLEIEGVGVYTFCQSQHLILLKVNMNLLPDDKIIYNKIRELGFDFYIKENATIAQALTTCSPEEIPPLDYQIQDNE